MRHCGVVFWLEKQGSGPSASIPDDCRPVSMCATGFDGDGMLHLVGRRCDPPSPSSHQPREYAASQRNAAKDADASTSKQDTFVPGTERCSCMSSCPQQARFWAAGMSFSRSELLLEVCDACRAQLASARHMHITCQAIHLVLSTLYI